MILTYVEIRDNRVKKSSFEILSEAKRRASELGENVAAVLLGQAGEKLTPELFDYGASRVYLMDHPMLAQYSTGDYAAALAALVRKVNPSAIFFPATSLGRDLAPRLAAQLGVALASDCTKVSVNDGRFEFSRPIFAGKAILSLTLNSSPQVATLRPNVFPLEKTAGQGEVVREEYEPAAGKPRAQVVGLVGERGGELDVTEADVIISGGRGMKGPENFGLLQELSALIPRSAVGASRSAVDSGWIGHQHQVGQTGKTVSPNLYLAFGISGAIQHLAGMSSSKVIVAVNKDPDAPIFKVADFGVVGDLFQVIPVLKEELGKLRSE
jgi:electron transfer flavoprotein alpha subunit